jgi:hypothetical protein
MPPVCLVCGKPLKATGGDVNMYYCDKRKEWVSEFGIHLDVTDTVIYIDPNKRRETMWIVEVPPYRFTMTNFSTGPKTEVHKTVIPDWAPWDKDVENKEMFLHKKLILTVPALMNLPWYDKKQVFNRLKLYLLFS